MGDAFRLVQDLPPVPSRLVVRGEDEVAALRGACATDPGPVSAGGLLLGFVVETDPTLPPGVIELRARSGRVVSRTQFGGAAEPREKSS